MSSPANATTESTSDLPHYNSDPTLERPSDQLLESNEDEVEVVARIRAKRRTTTKETANYDWWLQCRHYDSLPAHLGAAIEGAGSEAAAMAALTATPKPPATQWVTGAGYGCAWSEAVPAGCCNDRPTPPIRLKTHTSPFQYLELAVVS
ncbi:hypothetical protein B0A49_11358 [Cryomyces minteri]|uniref:Uncharacterized protein n=1 Tax=Cryomyces minteri TaxID=331657 RepID=A0A4V5NCV2_9PEZI|nr:hypothetical protein B0A49_11358 [Cryomyces minteri]